MSHVILSAGPIARSRNGVIGRDGGLPWRLKSDLAIFRAVTMGKPVIMGRKTWDSLPKKPLVGRTNIVLSRDGSFEAKGAVVCEDFSEAVQIAREQAQEDGQGEVCVIGGASLFDLALTRAQRLYLNHLDQARLQLSREPLPLPVMRLADKDDLFGFAYEDFKLEGYQAHPAIPAPIAV